MTIDERLSRVPAFTEFHGTDELYAHALRVVALNAGLCSLEYVGESKSGEKIPMVKVGDGPVSILLFASPHPNEPIGAMMAYFLLDELVKCPDMREGRTWHIVPCIDPDGTRRNEGWFKGPYTLKNYAREFYRPRGDDQAEWTFPIEYKTFTFDKPIPETRALMRAIDIARPSVMYSLHNSGFGGAYYYISRPLEAAYADFHRLPTERGLPLSLGEPESPYCKELHPAIYATNLASDAYDYFEKFASGDPAQYMFGGGSSRDYAEKVSKPFTLITEVPYFKTARTGDTRPVGKKRGDVLLQGMERSLELLTFAQEIVDATLPLVTAETVFRDASVAFIRQILKRLDGEKAWAMSAEIMAQEATVAQEANALYIGPFYQGLIISMYRRALRAQLDAGFVAVLDEAYRRLDERLDSLMDGIGEALDYGTVAIRDLVQIQYGALLAVLGGLGL
jgi:hypothetical protein